MATIRGTNGDDRGALALNGTDLADLMNGFSGNDELFGKGGNDNMHGDAGNDTLHGGDGNDLLDGGLDGNPFDDSQVADSDTLDGGNGVDTADYSNVQHSMIVDLALGFSEAFRGGSHDTLISVENVTGTNFADELVGNNVANAIQGADGSDTVVGAGGNDLLFGNSGNDVLVGGSGKDTLSGGSGADKFVFGSVGDSVVGTGRDVISNFSRSDGDHLDLHFIDASTRDVGDQAFHFIGTATFSGAAGELRFAATTGGLVFAGDVNGDRVSDFQVEAHTTLASFVAGDFLL